MVDISETGYTGLTWGRESIITEFSDLSVGTIHPQIPKLKRKSLCIFKQPKRSQGPKRLELYLIQKRLVVNVLS